MNKIITIQLFVIIGTVHLAKKWKAQKVNIPLYPVRNEELLEDKK